MTEAFESCIEFFINLFVSFLLISLFYYIEIHNFINVLMIFNTCKSLSMSTINCNEIIISLLS